MSSLIITSPWPLVTCLWLLPRAVVDDLDSEVAGLILTRRDAHRALWLSVRDRICRGLVRGEQDCVPNNFCRIRQL
jgi:hypothetical protein